MEVPSDKPPTSRMKYGKVLFSNNIIIQNSANVYNFCMNNKAYYKIVM